MLSECEGPLARTVFWTAQTVPPVVQVFFLQSLLAQIEIPQAGDALRPFYALYQNLI